MFDMLSMTLNYRGAINDFTQARECHKFELTDAECTVLGDVRDVLKVRLLFFSYYSCLTTNLQVLKDATLYFSRGIPTLATVIPAMNRIDAVFMTALIPATQINGPAKTLSLAIRSSLLILQQTLNKYYSLSDDSELYHIAISTSIQL